jgi:hypothetical protein
MESLLGKKPWYDFVPRKSLEEVIDVLKERFYPVATVDMTQGVLNRSTVKKNHKHKGHIISN